MSATLPSRLQMISELIACPSVSSTSPDHDQGNASVIDCLTNWLSPLGFECRVQALPDRPDKQNLVAILGDADNLNDALVLSGHSDTVPFDASGWLSDPFEASLRDDRIYGLGSADMKAFFAVCIEAAAQLQHETLKQPLVILVTCDEESGMDGARLLFESAQAPGRHVLIGEPTGMKPVRMHKGIFMERIVVSGKAGHSSRPDDGINAIDGMAVVIQALDRLQESLIRVGGPDAFNVPWATINKGRISGGDSPNRIPAHCSLDIDFRFPPLDSHDQPLRQLRETLHNSVRDALEGGHWGLSFQTLFEGIPAMQTPADAAIVRAVEALLGEPSQAVEFATEGAYFNAMGMQSVVLGPGDIGVAHQPNEFVALERLELMHEIVVKLIRQFCLN